MRMPAAWQSRDRLGDLGPRRVEERDEAEEAELALGVLASLGRLGAVGQAAPRDREHAEPLLGVALEHVEDLLAIRRP